MWPYGDARAAGDKSSRLPPREGRLFRDPQEHREPSLDLALTGRRPAECELEILKLTGSE